MPANRTSAELLLRLTAAQAERDRLKLENALLRMELMRHGSGGLQIRAVERRLAQLLKRNGRLPQNQT
ncbi:hypothetical protein [Fulvimonas soli]|jgi:hypothetical protein|uniref:Transposase n=1 Tax=Fulvimonas soli TaxID=155197 RepID=A0A316I025_9GAMM|nr:hypothetical protein [Fulvimonas soli]PWK85803.1 hypothetical protein C7456_10898 [Fulvimonas soli]TNY25745.1 hypothetical protein BV497_12775 [Fulvimonas soli]